MNIANSKMTWGTTLVFVVCAYLFFYGIYPFHICYQEQYQLFLFSSAYTSEMLSKPGGLAEYIAAYLTQFFISPAAGAFILAFLLGMLQRWVYTAAKSLGADDKFYPLTFLPSLFYWMLLCNENYMLVGLVAPILALALYPLSAKGPRLWAVYYILMPLGLYFFVGISCWIWFILWFAYEWKERQWPRRVFLAFAGWNLLAFLLFPLVLKYAGWMYPVQLLFFGTNFFRFPLLGVSSVVIVYMLLIACTPLFAAWLSTKVRSEGRRAVVLVAVLSLLVFGGCGYLIHRATDMEKEEILAYDYCIQHRDWKKVIELADRKVPSSPLSVACLNLALCKEGMMADRMFHYYQNGTEGLLPSFTKDFTAPLITSEIYYHIGFINTAQRYAFEAMECIPNMNKNVRVIKRLAETNIINGEYAVARKYLHLLQQTMFYHDWATETLSLLSDEQKVEQNEEWRQLRKYRTKKDFLFSEQEPDMMLGFVFSQDETNRVAYEYLMAVCLLRKDLKSFLQYYPLGKSIGYARIPESYQEAIVYAWGLQHKDMTGIPYPIDSNVLNRVNAYGRIYTSYANAEPMLRQQYSGTYWYYLHFR